MEYTSQQLKDGVEFEACGKKYTLTRVKAKVIKLDGDKMYIDDFDKDGNLKNDAFCIHLNKLVGDQFKASVEVGDMLDQTLVSSPKRKNYTKVAEIHNLSRPGTLKHNKKRQPIVYNLEIFDPANHTPEHRQRLIWMWLIIGLIAAAATQIWALSGVGIALAIATLFKQDKAYKLEQTIITQSDWFSKKEADYP